MELLGEKFEDKIRPERMYRMGSSTLETWNKTLKWRQKLSSLSTPNWISLCTRRGCKRKKHYLKRFAFCGKEKNNQCKEVKHKAWAFNQIRTNKGEQCQRLTRERQGQGVGKQERLIISDCTIGQLDSHPLWEGVHSAGWVEFERPGEFFWLFSSWRERGRKTFASRCLTSNRLEGPIKNANERRQSAFICLGVENAPGEKKQRRKCFFLNLENRWKISRIISTVYSESLTQILLDCRCIACD